MKYATFLFLCALFIFLNPSKTAAQDPAVHHQVKITASVGLSELWAQSIAINSQVETISIDPLLNKTFIKVTLIGLENKRLKNRVIRAEGFWGEKKVFTKQEITNHEGSVVFENEALEPVTVIFTDITNSRKVILQKKINLNERVSNDFYAVA